MRQIFVFAIVVGIVIAGQPEKELAKTLIERYSEVGIYGRPVDKKYVYKASHL